MCHNSINISTLLMRAQMKASLSVYFFACLNDWLTVWHSLESFLAHKHNASLLNAGHQLGCLIRGSCWIEWQLRSLAGKSRANPLVSSANSWLHGCTPMIMMQCKWKLANNKANKYTASISRPWVDRAVVCLKRKHLSLARQSAPVHGLSEAVAATSSESVSTEQAESTSTLSSHQFRAARCSLSC